MHIRRNSLYVYWLQLVLLSFLFCGCGDDIHRTTEYNCSCSGQPYSSSPNGNDSHYDNEGNAEESNDRESTNENSDRDQGNGSTTSPQNNWPTANPEDNGSASDSEEDRDQGNGSTTSPQNNWPTANPEDNGSASDSEEESSSEAPVVHGDNDHVWDSGVVTLEPTCLADGVKTYTCTGCQKTRTEAIQALGHEYDETGFCVRKDDLDVVLRTKYFFGLGGDISADSNPSAISYDMTDDAIKEYVNDYGCKYAYSIKRDDGKDYVLLTNIPKLWLDEKFLAYGWGDNPTTTKGCAWMILALDSSSVNCEVKSPREGTQANKVNGEGFDGNPIISFTPLTENVYLFDDHIDYIEQPTENWKVVKNFLERFIYYYELPDDQKIPDDTIKQYVNDYKVAYPTSIHRFRSYTNNENEKYPGYESGSYTQYNSTTEQTRIYDDASSSRYMAYGTSDRNWRYEIIISNASKFAMGDGDNLNRWLYSTFVGDRYAQLGFVWDNGTSVTKTCNTTSQDGPSGYPIGARFGEDGVGTMNMDGITDFINYNTGAYPLVSNKSRYSQSLY